MDASVYEALDEWGIYGSRRAQLKRMVIAIHEGIDRHERDKRDQRDSKPSGPKGK